jgi:hypothetical protein
LLLATPGTAGIIVSAIAATIAASNLFIALSPCSGRPGPD